MLTLSESFWNNEKLSLLAILRPRLEHMAVEAAKHGAEKAGIAFNPALANASAAQWARNYTDQILESLGTTSEKGIGEIIAKWAETPGATVGQLQQSLSKFGAVRAQAIAVTETTRAYAEGEEMAYKQEGLEEWRWNTNRDEIVCPVCGPLNNKIVKIGELFAVVKGKEIRKPPAHVHCRCFVSPIVKPRPVTPQEA